MLRKLTCGEASWLEEHGTTDIRAAASLLAHGHKLRDIVAILNPEAPVADANPDD